nr:translation initiation factor IF-2-like [Pongo abelii]
MAPTLGAAAAQAGTAREQAQRRRLRRPRTRGEDPRPRARRACAPRPPDRPQAGTEARLRRERAPFPVDPPSPQSRKAFSRGPGHSPAATSGPVTHGSPAHRPQAPRPARQSGVLARAAGSPRSRTDAAPASRTPPMQRPGWDVKGWRVLRECPAKPSYLGGLPGEGSQDGSPHTGGGGGGGGDGGGSSARPLPGGAGAGLPADWSRALMDSRHVPPPGSAGLARRLLWRRPDLRLSVPPLLPGWPSVVLSFGEFPPKREHPLQGR